MKNDPTILFDFSDANGVLLCSVDQSELKETKAAHRAAGVRVRVRKRIVYDTLTKRQTAIRVSRFGYLHRQVESKPAPISSFPTAPPKASNYSHSQSDATQQNHFDSDFGCCADHRWRPLRGVGHIHAIATIAGEAIATDGVLIAIRLPTGAIAVGHLDNWVPVKEAKVGGRAARMKAFIDELIG